MPIGDMGTPTGAFGHNRNVICVVWWPPDVYMNCKYVYFSNKSMAEGQKTRNVNREYEEIISKHPDQSYAFEVTPTCFNGVCAWSSGIY